MHFVDPVEMRAAAVHVQALPRLAGGASAGSKAAARPESSVTEPAPFRRLGMPAAIVTSKPGG
jgi:hypothetical protein